MWSLCFHWGWFLHYLQQNLQYLWIPRLWKSTKVTLTPSFQFPPVIYPLWASIVFTCLSSFHYQFPFFFSLCLIVLQNHKCINSAFFHVRFPSWFKIEFIYLREYGPQLGHHSYWLDFILKKVQQNILLYYFWFILLVKESFKMCTLYHRFTFVNWEYYCKKTENVFSDLSYKMIHFRLNVYFKYELFSMQQLITMN